MIAAHGRGHGRGLPRSLLSGTLASHGPLLSLVFRTEDVWQRYNQYRNSRSSQSGFPLLTPTIQTDRTRMRGWLALRECARCMQWLSLCFCGWQGLVNRSMRIQDLYVGQVPVPRFIKEYSYSLFGMYVVWFSILILVSCISLVYLCVVSL